MKEIIEQLEAKQEKINKVMDYVLDELRGMKESDELGASFPAGVTADILADIVAMIEEI